MWDINKFDLMLKTPSNEGSNNGVADVKYQKAIK
jgi:hypothetical protein